MTFFRRIVQPIRSKVIQLITLAERRINTATNFLLIALSLSLCLIFSLCILALIFGKNIYENPFATFVLYFWLVSTGLFISELLLSVFLSLIKFLVQFHIYGIISSLKSIALEITSTIRLLLAILKLLVASPRISIRILVFLAKVAYSTARMLIRNSRRNPKEIFRILVRELRWAAHKRSYVSPELSESLIQSRNDYFTYKVAGYPLTHTSVLNRLSQSSNDRVRALVASNSNTSTDTLETLAHDLSESVLEGIAHNSNTPTSLLRILLEDLAKTFYARSKYIALSRLIECSDFDEDLLEKVLSHRDSSYRRLLRDNSNLSVEALWRLCRTSPEQLIAHPKYKNLTSEKPYLMSDIPAGTLKQLLKISEVPENIVVQSAKSHEAAVRVVVANSRKTSTELLKLLAYDADSLVRCTVARNPNTPKGIIYRLALDSSRSVRSAVAHNPKTTEVILQTLARDVDKHVRISVARNSKAPQSILNFLVNDKDEQVRHHALRTLRKYH
jgi:Leucine rich repeat variant